MVETIPRQSTRRGARLAVLLAVGEDAVRIAVVTRLSWIEKKQREFDGQARQSERQHASGDTHFQFGKPVHLLVGPSTGNRCRIRPSAGDRLLMDVPEGATKDRKAR